MTMFAEQCLQECFSVGLSEQHDILSLGALHFPTPAPLQPHKLTSKEYLPITMLSRIACKSASQEVHPSNMTCGHVCPGHTNFTPMCGLHHLLANHALAKTVFTVRLLEALSGGACASFNLGSRSHVDSPCNLPLEAFRPRVKHRSHQAAPEKDHTV